MTAKALILASTGKTGRRLLPLLDGLELRAASRSGRVGSFLFDWDQEATHKDALSGTDRLYLVPPDIADPTPVTGPFLDQARSKGVRRVVLLSLLGVTFPDEPENSGRRKLEAQVRNSGMDWIILRPSGFNQNFSEGFLLPGILQAGAVVSSTGDGKVGFVDAGDIAAVAAAALIHDSLIGETLPVTGPQALSFADAAAIISEAAGRDISHRAIPSEAFRDILTRIGASPDYAEIPVRDQSAIRAGQGAQVADTVEKVTGRPAKDFRSYAVEAASFWRQ